MKKQWILLSVVVAMVAGLIAGCGSKDTSNSKANGNGEGKQKVTIGYFPNINHAGAMVAREKGFYEEALGDNVNVQYETFADGSAFMTALKTGEIDGGLVGPGPAMNNYANGADVKMIAGGSTGGTVIIARKGSNIDSYKDIAGKTFITPRVGCTHDVQLETYMKKRGIKSNRIGGSMKHVTGKPAQYPSMFKQEKIDVAAAPAPWASVIEKEVGGNVIITPDEVSFGKTLPAAVFATSGDMIANHEKQVQQLIDAHKKAIAYINENPEEVKKITVDAIKNITDQTLSKEVIDSAWERTDFTYELHGDTIQNFANSSYDLKFLKEKPDLSGLVDKQFIK